MRVRVLLVRVRLRDGRDHRVELLLGRVALQAGPSNACDWVPQDFVDRFVTRNISYASAAKQIEYDYCKRWTGGGNIMDLATAKSPKGLTCPNVLHGKQLIAGVSYQDRQSLTAMRTFLDKVSFGMQGQDSATDLKS